MCTRKAPGALILNIFVPGLNPEHRNSSVSLKDTIPAFNMIKDFQDCSLKMQLVHRLIFYPLTQKKLRSCSQRGCSSELLCTARLGEKNQKIKEGTEARLRLTWADLKFLGAPAINGASYHFLDLLSHPCSLPVPWRVGGILQAKHFQGTLDKVWMQDVSRRQFSCLEVSLERFQVTVIFFSQTVLSRRPLGSVNNFLIIY